MWLNAALHLSNHRAKQQRRAAAAGAKLRFGGPSQFSNLPFAHRDINHAILLSAEWTRAACADAPEAPCKRWLILGERLLRLFCRQFLLLTVGRLCCPSACSTSSRGNTPARPESGVVELRGMLRPEETGSGWSSRYEHDADLQSIYRRVTLQFTLLHTPSAAKAEQTARP